MWVAFAFGLVNVLLSLIGKKVLKLPGFDLTPLGIIAVAQAGDSVLFGALILTLSYSFTSLKKMTFLWLTVPATIIVGYLALVVPAVLLLIILYHLLCAIVAFFLGFFGFRYTLFVIINLGLNLGCARLYMML